MAGVAPRLRHKRRGRHNFLGLIGYNVLSPRSISGQMAIRRVNERKIADDDDGGAARENA
jgi:hypothetical protein